MSRGHGARTPRPATTDVSRLLGRTFTAEQRAAATAPLTPQLIVAGAGSGKTAVMAARVVHAVAEMGVPAEAVLGLTFTNKAAAELAERVDAALWRLPARDGDAPGLDGGPTVATYHAFAAGVVREHAGRLSREPSARVLSQAARWQLALRVVHRAEGPFEHLPWTPGTVADYLLRLDAELSEHLVRPEELARFDADLVAVLSAGPGGAGVAKMVETAAARRELVALLREFRAAKREADLIDHGDQVALAVRIAECSPDVVVQARRRHRLVLLDEYQDTGVSQRRLLTTLFGDGHPVTAVGDPVQGIYGWRGASAGNLHRFPEHFATATAAGETVAVRGLTTSFRCAGRILAVADRVAADVRAASAAVPGVHPAAGSRVAPLRPAPGAAAGTVRAALLDCAGTEAAWVARQLRALADGGVPPGDMAVLCRRRAEFAGLLEALAGAGLPVEVVGLGGLLSTPSVADLVAVLRLVVDPGANDAALRVLTGPRWRIGPRDLAALGRRAARIAGEGQRGRGLRGGHRSSPPGTATGGPRDAGTPDAVELVALLDAVADPGPAEDYSPAALHRFAALHGELADLAGVAALPVADAVAATVTRIGLDVEVAASPPAAATAVTANLAAFAACAAEFVGPDGRSDLAAFLDFCAAAEVAEDGLDVSTASAGDTVKLMTVHAAKGLEWPVVAVPGLTERVFPSERARGRWPTSAAVLPWPLRGDAEDLPTLPGPPAPLRGADLQRYAEGCRAVELAEELRLGYVAVTRAREVLLLSGSYWPAGTRRRAGPSQLLRRARALAGTGAVELDAWLEPDDAPGENPCRWEGSEVLWPDDPTGATAVGREAAAALVRAAAAAGPPWPAETAAEDGLDATERALVAGWRADGELLVAELRVAAGPVAAVPLPRRVATTQLVELARDPDGLAGRLARPMPAAPRRRARRGTRFHDWVATQYGQRPLWDPDELPGAADGPDPGDTDEELAALRRSFLAGPYGDRVPVAVEAGFELAVGGHVVRGRIDAVYRDPDGGYDVVDFKTGVVPAGPGPADLQLAVYRLAWADLAGVAVERVRAAFLDVRTGRVRRPATLPGRPELVALLAPPER